MRTKRRQLWRRLQRSAAIATAIVFAGFVGALAVVAGFEAQHDRDIQASQQTLGDLARIQQQPTVLGVAGVQRHVKVTEPHIYKPALPPPSLSAATAASAAVYRIPTSEPVVFITIDDGVTPDKAGLEIMRQRRAVAALFLNQVNVHKHRDYYRQWQDAGSTIQNHTLSHPRLPKMQPDQQQHEICTNAEWLKGEYGTRPALFRPPYGEFNDTTRQTAGSCGQKYLVHWSAVVENGQINYARGSMQPGEILLLHFTPDLARDLQAVFADADARGFKIGKLEDWLP